MASAFVFVATYRTVDDALTDYGLVKDLYSRGVIDTYDAAVVNKDADGNVHVSKREKPTQKGAWTGSIVGALIGVLFPPSILPMAAAGALTGGLIGHVAGGLSRADLKDLGEALDTGTAAIVVVAKTSGGKFYTAQKLVKVTIGGCGG